MREKQFNEVIDEHFPQLPKDTNPQIKKFQKTLSRINKKKSMPKHIVMKSHNIKAKT